MDSRFELEVKFEIYGQKFGHSCSLNWSAEFGEIDRRITDMFLEWHDEAHSAWLSQNCASKEKRVEEVERAELARLLIKYPDFNRQFV